MKKLFWLSVVAAGIYVWLYGVPHMPTAIEKENLPAKAVPGILYPPQQTPLTKQEYVQLNGYTLSKIARYTVSARILGKKNYSIDREADLSPVDLALGWNLMASRKVISDISISQGARYYNWYASDLPLPQRQIEISSANVHMIPANAQLKQKLKSLKHGQVVTLKGYLVNVSAKDGWNWQSSTTREDTGMGACEVFYVENIVVH